MRDITLILSPPYHRPVMPPHLPQSAFFFFPRLLAGWWGKSVLTSWHFASWRSHLPSHNSKTRPLLLFSALFYPNVELHLATRIISTHEDLGVSWNFPSGKCSDRQEETPSPVSIHRLSMSFIEQRCTLRRKHTICFLTFMFLVVWFFVCCYFCDPVRFEGFWMSCVAINNPWLDVQFTLMEKRVFEDTDKVPLLSFSMHFVWFL